MPSVMFCGRCCVPLRYMVVSVFSKHGKIVKYEYLWNKTGPRRGLPRGCCFIEYSTPEVRVTNRRAAEVSTEIVNPCAVLALFSQEAQAAKDAIHGKKMLGRPVVVRFTDERVVSTTGAAPRRSTSAVTQREPPKPPSIDKLEAVYDAKIHEIEHHLDSLVGRGWRSWCGFHRQAQQLFGCVCAEEVAEVIQTRTCVLGYATFVGGISHTEA